jgi:hypothetical protein
MDANQAPVIPCLLSQKAIYTIRQYIYHGTKGFANRADDHKWLKRVFGSSFDDIEIAISSEGYTCEKAPMLLPNEYASFIRIKDKWSETAPWVKRGENERTLVVGLVLSLTGRPTCPATCRLWQECPLKWTKSGDEKGAAVASLNDPQRLDEIVHEILAGFNYACSKPLPCMLEEGPLKYGEEEMGSNASSGAGTNAASTSSISIVAEPTPVTYDDMPALEES